MFRDISYYVPGFVRWDSPFVFPARNFQFPFLVLYWEADILILFEQAPSARAARQIRTGKFPANGQDTAYRSQTARSR